MRFRPIKGRMKICSRSLFFDPQDEHLPIFKYDFMNMTRIEPQQPDQFIIYTTRFMETRAHNIIGPYKFNEVF